MSTIWETPIIVEDDSGGNYAVNNMIVHNGLVWTHTYVPGSPLKNYFSGYDITTGDLVANIYIPDLDNLTWFIKEISVDQNGYIWVKGRVARTAFYVIDPIAQTIVQSLFTMSNASWSHNVVRFDPINNLMWSIKDANPFPQTATLAGISTITYTESITINLMDPSYNDPGSMAVDTDKGELWLYYGTNNIRIYRCSDGVLLNEITSSFIGINTYMQYVKEKKSILIYDDTNTPGEYEIWSTTSYSRTNVFTSKVDYPSGFIPKYNRMYGTSYDSSSDTFLTAYFDWDNLSAGVTTGCGDVFPCRKGIGLDVIYALKYVGDDFKLIACSFPPPSILCTDEDTSSNNDNVTNYDVFNRELILDLNLQAFFVYDLAHNNTTYIRDYIDIPSYTVTFEDELVYVGNDLVTDTAPVNLTISGSAPKQENRNTDERREPFKFIATTGTAMSVAEYKDYKFVDWRSLDGGGYPYNTYLLTGYELTGEMMRQKQAIYLKLYFDRTEYTYTLDSDGNVVLDHQSGCKVQAQWDWNNSADNGKWGIPFQGYRLLRPQPTAPTAGDTFNYGERVIVTKNKLRGRGHCLSLLFVPECGKDTKLLGWGLDMTGNTTS